jgi:hypothetical protein
MSLNYTQIGEMDQLLLLENMVHYLDNRDWQADLGWVKGAALLQGEEDHSGIRITTDPPTISAWTGADGSYTLYNLAPGTYRVIAAKDGFESDQVDGVIVVADETTTGVDLQLASGSGQFGDIAGTALLDGESNHSGITVSTIPASVTATTAIDGSYTLSDVPVGSYSVLATKDGWTDDQVDDVVVVANQTTSGIDLLLYEEAANLPPEAENQQVSTKTNQSVLIELEASDPNGDPLTYICVDLPEEGTLSGCEDGDEYVTYTPAKRFTGTETFTFMAYDGDLYSNEATVTVKVTKGGGGGGKPTDGMTTPQLNPLDTDR